MRSETLALAVSRCKLDVLRLRLYKVPLAQTPCNRLIYEGQPCIDWFVDMLAVWKKLPYEIGPDQVSIVVFNEKPEDYEFHFYLHENMEQIDLLEAVLYCGERVDSFHVDIGLVEDVESFGFWEFFFSCLEAAHLREISLRMMLDTGAYNDALCKALSCMRHSIPSLLSWSQWTMKVGRL